MVHVSILDFVNVAYRTHFRLQQMLRNRPSSLSSKYVGVVV